MMQTGDWILETGYWMMEIQNKKQSIEHIKLPPWGIEEASHYAKTIHHHHTIKSSLGG